MRNLDKGVEEWLVDQTKNFIDDSLQFMISRKNQDPRLVSEALVRTLYNSLFEAVVKVEAYAGRLPLGASLKSVRTTEFVHEKVVHKLVELAIAEIQPGSKYIWTAWISKRQKPL